MTDNIFDENEFEEVNEILDKSNFWFENKKEIENFVDCLKPNKVFKEALFETFGKEIIKLGLANNSELFYTLSNPPSFVSSENYDKLLDSMFSELAQALKENHHKKGFNFVNKSIIDELDEIDKGETK